MLFESRTARVLIPIMVGVALFARHHHAAAQTCNCSCDAIIPQTLDVGAAFMNEGPGASGMSYVSACRNQTIPFVASYNVEIRHATQLAITSVNPITHFCAYLKSPTGLTGETAYAFIAALDPNNQNLPGNTLYETPFTINGTGHQLIQLNTPVAVNGTVWAGIRYPTARCNIGHQGVHTRNQGRAALYIAGPGGAGGGGGWMDYESTNSGHYVGKAPLIRPLSLVPAGAGGGGGAGGCRIIVGPQTNAAGLLETDELGGNSFVSLQLTQQPLAPVYVNIGSNNTAEGIVSTTNLYFDANNWISPQFFTVNGVDDPLFDGPINYRVEFSVASADACYNLLPVPAVNCVNLDDETSGVYCGGMWRHSVPFGMVPAPLADPAMTFDSYRNVAVMFGGPPGMFGPGETWEWDGAQWKLVTVSGPSCRTGHALAFDSHRNVIVLMGGTDAAGIQLSDTWEYNGAVWTLRSAGIPNAPGGPRVDHAMAFDERRGVTVLFGGDPLLGTNQAWQWDGITWTPRPHASTPARRSNHMMTYDARRQRVLLFSGFLNTAPFIENVIWEYDGTTWVQVTAINPGPSPRQDAGFVHDPVRGVSILFGGNAGGVTSDTWEWDGNARSWSPMPNLPPVPMGRTKHAMAYDIPRRVAVVFGGDNGGGFGWISDTWLYDPAGPSLPVGAPLTRYFLVRGTGSGLPYSWALTLHQLTYGALLQGGLPFGLHAGGIAGILGGQISAATCGQISASPHPLAPSIISVSTSSPLGYGLSFGSAGTRPGCSVAPFAVCAFNPTIKEVYLDGVDCNANGMDDTIDLANDEALDANLNGVLDSCEVVSNTGDVNCDGLINILDVDAFILGLLDPAMYAMVYPECPASRADTNNDGQNDGRDVAAFVALIQQ